MASPKQPSVDQMRQALEQFLAGSQEKRRLYHGTSSDVQEFQPSAKGALGHGIYLTDDPDAASRFADRAAVENKLANAGKNVMPVHINAKRMLDVDKMTPKQLKALLKAIPATVEELEGFGYPKYEGITRKMIQDELNDYRKQMIGGSKFDPRGFAKILGEGGEEAFANIMNRAGFDALTRVSNNLSGRGPYRESTVLRPTQIKSAIGNRGTYDTSSKDITMAGGGNVKPFDYENPQHVENVASIAAKHRDFNKIPDVAKHLAGSLAQGSYKIIEDPRIQQAIKQAGHNGYFINHKNGKEQIVKKADGGAVPSIDQMRMELDNKTKFKGLSQLQSIGVNEAPGLGVKAYVPPAGRPDNGQIPVGGVDTSQGDLPVGGIDMSQQQPGQQLMPTPPGMDQVPQGDRTNIMDGTSAAPTPNTNPPPGVPGGNSILQMTPQGQMMAAMGGGQQKPQGLAKGGQPSIEQMKSELADRIKPPCMTDGHGYADGGQVFEEAETPRQTVKAYKLFRADKKRPGQLFPLFVDANTPVEVGKWLAAKEGEMRGNKVRSKIGDLAYRPGWHAGDLPIATHIGEKSHPSLTAPDTRPEHHVWAEVEMPHDVDWQAEANKRGTNTKGNIVPVKAHITDQIPVGGHYRYKTNPNMTGNWLIGGSMKVNRVLSDAEVRKINKAAGVADLPRAKKQKLADYGFAEGGSTSDKYNPPATKASEALGKHEGKTLKVTQADRTKVGGGFLGGPGFSSLQHVDPRYQNAAWGVNTAAAASKIANATADDVLWSALIGAPAQHTSNQMVFDLLLDQFKKGIKSGKMSPELRAAINARLAAAKTKEGAPIFGNADIAGKNFFKSLNTFDKRRVMADLMGGQTVGGKKGQIFDYDKIVRETTEPELLGAPTHAIGPRLFKATGERSFRPDLHPAFPHILHGEDLGVMYHPVPREVMLPDFHNQIRQTKGRGVGFMDLTRNTPAQFLSEKFLTGLQKQGYKKGGGVKLHTDQDTMALELSRKSKKAK